MSDRLDTRCDPRFVPYLDRFGLRDVDDYPDTIYGVWPDLTLAYYNRAWTAFAAANGGEPHISAQWRVGRLVLDAFPDCLRSWYRGFIGVALAAEAGHPPQEDYECSSPDLYRRFLMTVYAVRGASGMGLLVVNSLQVETVIPAHDAHPVPVDSAAYRDSAGYIHQCAHCRRVQAHVDSRVWHWIPGWVKNPPANVTHGLCQLCLGHFYPAAAAGTSRPRGTLSTGQPALR